MSILKMSLFLDLPVGSRKLNRSFGLVRSRGLGIFLIPLFGCACLAADLPGNTEVESDQTLTHLAARESFPPRLCQVDRMDQIVKNCRQGNLLFFYDQGNNSDFASELIKTAAYFCDFEKNVTVNEVGLICVMRNNFVRDADLKNKEEKAVRDRAEVFWERVGALSGIRKIVSSPRFYLQVLENGTAVDQVDEGNCRIKLNLRQIISSHEAQKRWQKQQVADSDAPLAIQSETRRDRKSEDNGTAKTIAQWVQQLPVLSYVKQQLKRPNFKARLYLAPEHYRGEIEKSSKDLPVVLDLIVESVSCD